MSTTAPKDQSQKIGLWIGQKTKPPMLFKKVVSNGV